MPIMLQSIPMKIDEVREKVLPILKKNAIKRASIFGSTARGEEAPRDIDMLIDMPRPYGLFAFLSLKKDLEETLGVKVDLIDYRMIKAPIRERILRDEVLIL